MRTPWLLGILVDIIDMSKVALVLVLHSKADFFLMILNFPLDRQAAYHSTPNATVQQMSSYSR